MKKPPKPFLPSKKELKGCLWLLLIIPALIVAMTTGKMIAEFVSAIVPPVATLVAFGIISILIILLWFYRKRKRKERSEQKALEIGEAQSQINTEKEKHEIQTTEVQDEDEYKRNVWEIYRKEWETASPEKRMGLNKRMAHWQELTKNGWTASQAYIRVMEEETDGIPQLIPSEKKAKARTRRPLLLVLAFVILLSISLVVYARISTSTPEPSLEQQIPAHFITYTDEAGLFSISYPPKWELALSKIEGLTQDVEGYLKDIGSEGSLVEGKVVFFAGIPYETGHNPNVSVVVTLTGEGKWELEDFVELVVQQGYIKDAEEYHEFSRTKTVVDGKEAIILDYEAKYPLIGEMRILAMYVRDSNLMWVVTCGIMPPKDFSYFETDFHAIAKSLRVLE